MRNSQSFIITEVDFVFISDRNGLYLTRRCPVTSILPWFFNAFPSFTQKKKYRGTRTAQDNQNKNMVLITVWTQIYSHSKIHKKPTIYNLILLPSLYINIQTSKHEFTYFDFQPPFHAYCSFLP